MPEHPICGARTRKGTPCQHEQGWGTQHGPEDGRPGTGRCKLHGGSEPHAQVNGMVILARREQQAMGMPLAIEPQDAILECIRIAAGEVAYASERICELDQADAVGAPRRTLVRKSGGEEGGTVQEVRQDPPALHVWIVVRQQAMDRLVQYSLAALKAGIEERRVRVAEQQGEMLAEVIRGVLSDLGVQNRPEVPSIVRRRLQLVAGQAVS